MDEMNDGKSAVEQEAWEAVRPALAAQHIPGALTNKSDFQIFLHSLDNTFQRL